MSCVPESYVDLSQTPVPAHGVAGIRLTDVVQIDRSITMGRCWLSGEGAPSSSTRTSFTMPEATSASDA